VEFPNQFFWNIFGFLGFLYCCNEHTCLQNPGTPLLSTAALPRWRVYSQSMSGVRKPAIWENPAVFSDLMNGEVTVVLLVGTNGVRVPNPKVRPWWQWEFSRELRVGEGVARTFCCDEPIA